MKFRVSNSTLSGQVEIPTSKSHMLRAIYIGSLGDGSSEMINPLESWDTVAGVRCAEAFGAEVKKGDRWIIKGVGGRPKIPENVLDAANSGGSLSFFTGMASLVEGYTVLTGDAQNRRRPQQPLIDALNDLGAIAFSTRNNGSPPLVIKGKLRGGRTKVDGRGSIFTSTLLLTCPLIEGDTELSIIDPKEKPYVEITLSWLAKQKIQFKRDNYSSYFIPGGQHYLPFKETIPADFSTATFFLCGASITESDVTLLGLDMNDSQGDKKVVYFLQEMGADITVTSEGLRVRGGDLKGIEMDLSDTPDALPALALTGCFARGKTVIRNVLSARWKETDRIKVMCQELSKLGASVKELDDGMIIEESPLKGAVVNGHGDHRLVMALSLAGLRCTGDLEVETAEAVSVTVPNFVDLMKKLGARISVIEG
jgi:3-phosphoshikimate 1-carboxyvinyltransferase